MPRICDLFLIGASLAFREHDFGDTFVENSQTLQGKLNYTSLARENTNYTTFYNPVPLDLLQLYPVHKGMHNVSNRNYTALNHIWLMSLTAEKDQIEFIEKMINEPKTVPINPLTMLDVVDNTPYPWLILVYHSDSAKNNDALNSLLKGMSKHFYERFGIASLDLSYPSNAIMMYEMFPNIKDTPAILLRAPNAIKTFLDGMGTYPMVNAHNESAYLVSPLNSFGEIFSPSDLHDIDKLFRTFNKIYEETTPEAIKTMTIFQPHYRELGKKYLGNYIKNIDKDFKIEIVKHLAKSGYPPLEKHSKFDEWSEIEKAKYQYIWESLFYDNLRKNIYGSPHNLIAGKLKEMYNADLEGDGPIHKSCKEFAELSPEERKKRRSEVEDYDKVCGGSVVKGKKPNFHGKVRRSWIPLKQVPYAPFMDDWNDHVAHVKAMESPIPTSTEPSSGGDILEEFIEDAIVEDISHDEL